MESSMLNRLILLACALPLHALAAPCLPDAALVARDQQYEEALRVGDTAFLQDLLADNYVWVHSLASQVEDKAALLARFRAPFSVHKRRATSDTHAHALGDAVTLRGISTVEQWNGDGKTWRTNRYQFMRTYVNVNGTCKLLAVQTMKVWSSDPK